MVDLCQWRARIGSWNNTSCLSSRISNKGRNMFGVKCLLFTGCVLSFLLIYLSGDIELNPGPLVNTTDPMQKPHLHLARNLSKEVLKACQSGDINLVHQLVEEEKCDITIKDVNDNTPLHLACQNDHYTIVKYLASLPKCTYSIRVKNKEGNTPLHVACISGSVDIVSHLVENKHCNINRKGNFGYTPLHWACLKGHTKLIEYLTGHSDCDKEAKNTMHKTPLQIACQQENISLVELLIKKGCSVEGVTSKCDKIMTLLDAVYLQQNKTDFAQLCVVKCILTGPPGAGKSTLKKRLLNETLKEPSLSTGVVDAAVHVDSFRKLSQHNAVVSTEWRKQNIEEEAVLVRNSLLSVNDREFHAYMYERSHLSNNASNGSQVVDYNSSLATNNDVISEIDDKRKLSTLTTLSKMTHKSSKPSYKNGIPSNKMLHIIDTGGQPEFHEILPALITGPAINLLVFKLTEDLHSRYTITYRSPTGDSTPYETSLTHEEVIFRSLASIACLRQNTIGWNFDTPPINDQSEPAAFLIATHRDCVNDSKVNEINMQLKIKINNSPQLFGSNLVKSSSAEDVIFALDTTKDEVESLRSQLHYIMAEQFHPLKLPASWCNLGLKLRMSKKNLFKYDTCYKLGQECGIKDLNDFQSALWYLHHRVGTIMHYPEVEGLGDIIITNLQLVFDRITNLITTCFTFVQSGNAAVEKEFCSNGRFSELQIDKISDRQKGDPFTHKRLVALLKHLYIVAGPIKEKVDRKTVNYYFMPCALKPTAVETEHRDPSIGPAPLLISFECGYTPVGVFCCLIVYLLSSNNDKQFPWMLTGDVHYRNKISFRVGKYYDGVILISQATYLEVWVERQNKSKLSIHSLCEQVLLTLHRGLITVTESLHYTYKSSHMFGFPCSCPLPSPHPAVVEYCDSAAKCFGNIYIMDLEERHFYWSKKIVELNEKNNNNYDDLPQLHVVHDKDNNDFNSVERITDMSENHKRQREINNDDVDLPPSKQLHKDSHFSDNPISIDTTLNGSYFTSILNIDDWNLILKQLPNDFPKWNSLAREIGLSYDKIESIKYEEQRINSRCLEKAVAEWLKQSYNVDKYGAPTWSNLLIALAKIGESNLANEIKRKSKRKQDDMSTIKKRKTNEKDNIEVIYISSDDDSGSSKGN